ncbi:hypothetical protein THAOC_13652 [Thalassiosira oceanica]|uniref:Uncharacterized protein n=1 Tax=Thalassiosira oceanica TaxID=159749 RepID=K0T4Y5_THAOC|nr:hypothetical protein THAOC_13652 [Thalassiosira oceanica]|eukprot:EJK65477.1 hypothetical protein THAOC_13652 [Thalassiosira oceanica]
MSMRFAISVDGNSGHDGLLWVKRKRLKSPRLSTATAAMWMPMLLSTLPMAMLCTIPTWPTPACRVVDWGKWPDSSHNLHTMYWLTDGRNKIQGYKAYSVNSLQTFFILPGPINNLDRANQYCD